MIPNCTIIPLVMMIPNCTITIILKIIVQLVSQNGMILQLHVNYINHFSFEANWIQLIIGDAELKPKLPFLATIQLRPNCELISPNGDVRQMDRCPFWDSQKTIIYQLSILVLLLKSRDMMSIDESCLSGGKKWCASVRSVPRAFLSASVKAVSKSCKSCQERFAETMGLIPVGSSGIQWDPVLLWSHWCSPNLGWATFSNASPEWLQ